MAQNPVKLGLVATLADYLYSSIRGGFDFGRNTAGAKARS
jgi:hypothetical protein